MQTIVTMAAKDLRLLTRDKLGMFFIVIFPVVMGVFFGLMNASFSSEPEADSMKIAVIDNDNSPMSRLFTHALSDVKALSTHTLPIEEAKQSVRKGHLVGFIEIPRGFGETAGVFWAAAPAIKLGVDPARAAEGAMLQGMIMQAMGTLIQHRIANPADMRPQLAKTMQQMQADPDMPATQRTILLGLMSTIDTFLGKVDQQVTALSTEKGDETQAFGSSMELVSIETVDVTASTTEGPMDQLVKKIRSPWDISFPSAIMWGVMACVAGFAVTVAKERQAGTFFRLQIAPITRTDILAGKAFACFLAVIAVIAFMMTLGLILGIQLARPDLLVIAAISMAVCFVGLMMFMSVLGRTEQSVAGAGWAIIVIMCMFGGGMVPLAFMPGFMKTLSHFSPVKWGILALEGAIWRNFTFTEMLTPCAVLIVVGAVFFTLGARILSRAAE